MPIDLTLEQIINADAASQRTGIAAFTNSISVRKRWAQKHFLRMSVVSHLLDTLNLNKKEDVTVDLEPYKMRKNADALKKLCNQIEESINPFDKNLEKNILVNIDIGKARTIVRFTNRKLVIYCLNNRDYIIECSQHLQMNLRLYDDLTAANKYIMKECIKLKFGGTIKNYIIRNGNIKIFMNDSTKPKVFLILTNSLTYFLIYIFNKFVGIKNNQFLIRFIWAGPNHKFINY